MIKPSLQVVYQLTEHEDEDEQEEEFALEDIDDQINQIAIKREEIPNNEFIFQFNPDFSLLNISPPQQTIVNALLEKGYSASEVFEYIMQLQKNHNSRQITTKLKELCA
jgi:tRNA G26 N,N-dimethylase Trm1